MSEPELLHTRNTTQTVAFAGDRPWFLFPNSPETSDAQKPPLVHSHYDEEDKQRVRDALRDLESTILDDVSGLQLEVHRAVPVLSQNAGTTNAPPLLDRMAEISDSLRATQGELARRFPQGRDIGDEVWDVLGELPLMAEVVALMDYMEAVKSLPPGSPPELRRLIGSQEAALQKANFALGNWVGEFNNRLRDKRKALGPA